MSGLANGEGEASTIVGVAEAAMHMYRAAIDSLPRPDHPKFHNRAEVILPGLRKLRASLTEAASRSRSTPSVIAVLSEVRRRYDEVMANVAESPGASLGQQLYAVRVRAGLSAIEVANGVGLPPDLPDALEAGEVPTEEEAAKVRQVIAALGGRVDFADAAKQPQPAPDATAWEESEAVDEIAHDADAAVPH